MSTLLALTAAVATLGLQLDADDTWTARTDRAVGASMLTSVPAGLVSIDFASSVSRDVPLAGVVDTSLKLGASAACVLNVDDWEANIAAVVENGAPRLDLGLALSRGDVEVAVELESIAHEAQLRFFIAWPLDP